MIAITFSAMTFLDALNINIQYPYLAHLLILLPIWAFHGEDDDNVPLQRSMEIISGKTRHQVVNQGYE
jgi:hypothetical protein